MKESLPTIAISVGDPAGIGPEIAVKAITSYDLHERCLPILVADPRLVVRAAARWAPNIPVRSVGHPADFSPGSAGPEILVFQEAGCSGGDYVLPEQGSAEAGQAAFDYLKAATSLALSGAAAAIATAPLNKEALSKAGWIGVGHTELLADFCAVERGSVAMMLASERLRVAHVSTHIPLIKAITSLSRERIVKVAELAGTSVRRMIGREPKIAVAGINPHAGEHGLFGSEELDTIEPAVKRLIDQGWQAFGPLPPDTIFARALSGEYDVVIAMYHDQGHIPSKLVGFHDTVNVTLGLPIIRVSVDHGTAYDIAWSGTADARNMARAIQVAADLVEVEAASV